MVSWKKNQRWLAGKRTKDGQLEKELKMVSWKGELKMVSWKENQRWLAGRRTKDGQLEGEPKMVSWKGN